MYSDLRIYFLMTRLLGEGRFEDVIEQLPRLQSLGVNVLWISPPHPQQSFVEDNRHGYWPSSHLEVDEALGGERQFVELIRQAEAHGIRLCVDLVLNHFGYGERFRMGDREVATSDLRYFKPTKDSEGPVHPREIQLWSALEKDSDPVSLRRYHRELARIPLYHLPSLEHASAEVREYLQASVRKFIDWGVDCFRVDAVKHMSFDFLLPFTEEMIRYGRTHGRKVHFLWELSIAKSHALDLFTKDALAQISDSDAISVIDFPLFYELRNLDREDSTFASLVDLIEERDVNRHAVKHFVPLIESHDMAAPLKSPFVRRMAYCLSEFVSFRPTILHHGTERVEAGGTGRDKIRAIDPQGEIGEMRTLMSDALIDYRDAPALSQFRKLHQAPHTLVLSRAIGGRTAYLAINKSDETVDTSFHSRAKRGSSLMLHCNEGAADVERKETDNGQRFALHLPPKSFVCFEVIEDRFAIYANGVARHLVPLATRIEGERQSKKLSRLSESEKADLKPEATAMTPAGKALEFRVCNPLELRQMEKTLGRKGFWHLFIPSGNFGKIPSGHSLVMVGGLVYSRNIGAMGPLSITSAPFEQIERYPFMNEFFRKKFFLAQFFEVGEESVATLARHFRLREKECRDSNGASTAAYCARPITSLRGGEATENCTTFAFPWTNELWAAKQPELRQVRDELGEMRFSELPALQIAFNAESPALRGSLLVSARPDYLRRVLKKNALSNDIEGRQLLFTSAISH